MKAVVQRRLPAVAAPVLALVLALLVSVAALADETVLVMADSTAIVRARAAAILLSGRDGGTFPMEVLALSGAGEISGEGGGTQVVVMAEVPDFGRLFVSQRGASQDGSGQDGPATGPAEPVGPAVEAFVYALAADGSVVAQGSLATSATGDLAKALESSQGKTSGPELGLKIFMTLSLEPGEYRLRVLVRTGRQAFAVRTAEIQVPAGGRQSLATPLVAAEGSWLVLLSPARQIPSVPAPSLPIPRLPIQLGGEGLLPAALVDGAVGAAITARLAVPPEAEEISFVEARADPGAGAGAGEGSSPVAVRGWRLHPGDAAKRSFLEVDLVLPALPEGHYRLRIRLIFRDGAALESAPLALRRVLPESPAPPPTQTAGKDPARKRGSGRPQGDKETRQAYRQILETLAGEGAEAALEPLTSLFETALGAGPEGGETLTEALAFLLRDGPRPWAGVLPILELHLKLVEKALAGQRHTVARGATTLIMALAQGRARSLASPEGRRLSALVLTGLGKLHERYGATSLAEQLFEAAVALDPSLESTALQLAFLLERKGRYSASARILSNLLSQRPEHREGRLRLSLLQLRQGRSSAGRRGLEGLAGEEPSDWIRLVAVQELVRALEAKGQTARSLEVEELGATLWPDNLALLTQRALHLDRQRRYAEARALLAAWKEPERNRRRSERLRYSHGPGFAEEPPGQRLEEAAAKELPALKARFLGAGSSGAGSSGAGSSGAGTS